MKLKLALGLTLGLVGWGTPVLAHGVTVEHRQVSSVELQAEFETGEPMANAQVLIYAPDSPGEIWQQGTADDQGRFTFAPDPSRPGNWEVMMRKAGHGKLTVIPVTDAANSAPGTEAETVSNSVISPSTTLSPVQRGITIGSVIWGFIGTALFFARGKR